MVLICRTCLQQISDTDCIKMENCGSVQVKNELFFCVPELVFELVKNPLMCRPCAKALHTAYTFKSQCLQTEQRIQSYLQNMPEDITDVCLQEVYNSINKSDLQPEFIDLKDPLITALASTAHDNDSVTTVFDSESVETVMDVNNIKEEQSEEQPMSTCEDLKNLQEDPCPQNLPIDEICDRNESSMNNAALSANPNDKPFICSFCSFRCARKVYLTKHIKYNHAGEKPFSCNMCDFTTAHKTHLAVHKRIHSGEKPFTCDVCSYSSSFKQNLLKHMRVHNGQKPFVCTMCEFSSAHHSSLRNHIKIHTGTKPFTCDQCDFTSAYSGSLTAHKRIHSGEKPFSCNICEFSTSRNDSLISHMKTHAEERTCNLCEYTTNTKQHLKEHMKVHENKASTETSSDSLQPFLPTL